MFNTACYWSPISKLDFSLRLIAKAFQLQDKTPSVDHGEWSCGATFMLKKIRINTQEMRNSIEVHWPWKI